MATLPPAARRRDPEHLSNETHRLRLRAPLRGREEAVAVPRPALSSALVAAGLDRAGALRRAHLYQANDERSGAEET